MKLIKFIYIKFFISFLLSVSVSFFIFYVFSLLGNLGENIIFSKILIVSLLNVLEIMTLIPSFLIFLSVILFLIVLKGNNEILIIKEYFNSLKLILVFFPIVLMSSYIEINKEKFSSIFTNFKNEIMGFDQNLDVKIIIDKNSNGKSILVLKGIDLAESKINKIQRYTIKDNRISVGEFSDDLSLFEGKLVANNIIKYFNEEITRLNNPITIIKDFDKYDNQKFVYKNFESKNEIKLNDFIRFLYFMIFFWCLIIIFLNREYLDKKKNLFIPFVVSLVLLVYSLIIGTSSMTEYNHLFSILTLSIFILVFIKYYKYE